MNPASLDEAKRLMRNFQFPRPLSPERSSDGGRAISNFQKAQIVICPPFVYLSALADYRSTRIKNRSTLIKLGAQDVFYESEGSYTGEISPPMLRDIGVKYVIIGHSERRALGETNEIVAKKIGACLKYLLTPIVCIGESSRDESGNYFSFIRTQIEEIFKNIPRSALNKIVIAYEPIWAIGKKAIREATPAESEEMAIFIRKVLSNIYDQVNASQVILLYGGSVNIKNAREFLKSGGVDGLLVGRDSLDAKKFTEIVKTR